MRYMVYTYDGIRPTAIQEADYRLHRSLGYVLVPYHRYQQHLKGIDTLGDGFVVELSEQQIQDMLAHKLSVGQRLTVLSGPYRQLTGVIETVDPMRVAVEVPHLGTHLIEVEPKLIHKWLVPRGVKHWTVRGQTELSTELVDNSLADWHTELLPPVEDMSAFDNESKSVYEQYMLGRSQGEIGDTLGITQAAMSYKLRTLRTQLACAQLLPDRPVEDFLELARVTSGGRHTERIAELLHLYYQTGNGYATARSLGVSQGTVSHWLRRAVKQTDIPESKAIKALLDVGIIGRPDSGRKSYNTRANRFPECCIEIRASGVRSGA